mmetsp:Transcript_22774/g.70943  ORF Transcript_22774/g.70943 Transcript_22774/m.70943 type:complete len:326 (+) Transcript_22774:512-1489(+)
MLPSLPLPVELDEALRAEEVDAVLAEHGGVEVLALEADKAVDDPLEVVAQVGPRGVERVDVHEAFVRVEQPALHALARGDSVLVRRADELLDVGGDVRAALAGGVGAVEAVLAEVVLALLALDDGRLLLALLAHHDARGLPDHVDLVLLPADPPQEVQGVPEVLDELGEVEPLLHVGLQRLLHATDEEELPGAVHAEDGRQGLHDLGRGRRESLGGPAHDLRRDGCELGVVLLRAAPGLALLEALGVASRLVVDVLVPEDQRVLPLQPPLGSVVVERLPVLVDELPPVRRDLSARGLLGDPQELRLVHEVDADHLRDAHDGLRRV